MSQVKRNLIQVRLNDDDFSEFNKIKKSLDAQNNADALRKLISDKTLVSGGNHQKIESMITKYDDLSAKVDALLWDSRNLTSNLNQIAHAVNVAKDSDPSNAETWNWVIQQLQKLFPTVEQLSNSASNTNTWLKESRTNYGCSSV